MKFGPVPIEAALGAVLAHSVATGTGRLRKGIVLGADHIAQLHESGIAEVTAARLDPDDVDENNAATTLAHALVPEPNAAGLRIGAAGTGRVNIFATGPGLARIDAAAIDRANMVDPMITIATVPQNQRLSENGMIATVKIIAYAVPQYSLNAAKKAAADALHLARPKLMTATLVQSVDAQANASKGEHALRTRLDRLGVDLSEAYTVQHQTDALADALAKARGEIIFILTHTATSDLHDTAPEALRQAGGTVDHFGMPVDPGNLLFIGSLNGRPVIGLPGCAKSPALNGADWVMERLICGIPVTGADIKSMGVGGLLKEIPSRPQPRRDVAGKDRDQ